MVFNQIVAWSEIFPTRRARAAAAGGDGEAGRTFLLAVGLGFQVNK